jgi:two-component system sensor histidine kinase RpfC
MISAFQWLKTRLSGRPDTEHAQDLVRIVITALFITYLGWRYLFLDSDDTLLQTWLILVGELTVAVGLLVAIVLRPGAAAGRRGIGACVTGTVTCAPRRRWRRCRSSWW